jgi:hypothetical protein
MKSEHSITLSVVAGFVLSALVIVAMATVIVPSGVRTDLFWPRVLWTIFLAGLVWGASASYFTLSARRKAKHRESGGIAPSLMVVTIIYAVLSFAAMLLHAALPPNETVSRTHLLIQLGLAGASAIVLVFLNLARSHAGLGVQTTFEGIASPADLCDLLSAEESRLATQSEHENWTRCMTALKSLRETLRYSLPQTTILADNSLYRRLVHGIETTCQTLHACAEPTSETVGQCIANIDSLKTEAKTLSSKTIRR